MALRLCLFGDYSRGTPLRTAVTYPVAVALVFGASQVLWSFMLWLHPWSASSLKAPLSRSCRATAYRWPGPTAPAPFPLSLGCMAVPGSGMHETTKQKLADDLVAWGYVTLLVDSFGTREIDHCLRI